MAKSLCFALFLATTSRNLFVHAVTEDRWYWYQDAQSRLNTYLSEPVNTNVAKNVIIFVGDGMGIPTVTAGRILRGQLEGGLGEDYRLTFENFPYLGLAKTYNVDSQVGDSAACATALLCGVKGNFETVGLDSHGKYDDCESVSKSRVPSIMDWAQKDGKWTGFVTNTRITHGTPAALFSNSASRYWEDDSKLPPKARGKCQDIAAQMIDNMPGKNLRVILGGGRRHLLPENTADPKLKGYFGKRADGRNLMQEWKTQKHDLDAKYSVVTTQKELADVDHNNTDYLLGVFSYSHMNFEMDRDDNDEGEPSLVDMTRRAIQVLKRGPEGFVLMVEAGRMDHAHHFSNARRALDEVHSLDDSVKAALELISPKDTLLIVTGDHSHTMTIGGYPKRGNPILGKDTRPSDVDNMPYTTLLYGNGPGYGVAGSGQDFHDDAGGADQHAAVASRRQDLSLVDTTASDYIQQSAVPRKWETHGGEDVPVYALVKILS
ncbi:unnamed protein product [Notodromas monacha]|uniref:alkaline phosphatase n=1 Tax=Notodromas monacha TaxID=399045 RepID=A0A7R9GBG0_9CRUS|nr:unnamed protein product [Notodromas monacha]CAG0916471.1 unnamed protein product [Notodromas monacha]